MDFASEFKIISLRCFRFFYFLIKGLECVQIRSRNFESNGLTLQKPTDKTEVIQFMKAYVYVYLFRTRVLTCNLQTSYELDGYLGFWIFKMA